MIPGSQLDAMEAAAPLLVQEYRRLQREIIELRAKNVNTAAIIVMMLIENGAPPTSIIKAAQAFL